MSNERNAVVVAGGNGQDTYGVTGQDTNSGVGRQIDLADRAAELVPTYVCDRMEDDLRGVQDTLDWSKEQRALELSQLQLERVSGTVSKIACDLDHPQSHRRRVAELALKQCKAKVSKAFRAIFSDEDPTSSLVEQVDEAIDDMVKTSKSGGTITREEEAEARKLLDLYRAGRLYVSSPTGKGGFGKLLLE